MNRLVSIIKHTPTASEILVSKELSLTDDVEVEAEELASIQNLNLDRLHSHEEWLWIDSIDRHMLITMSNDGVALPVYSQFCYTYKVEPIVHLVKDESFEDSINLHSSTIKPSNTEVGLCQMAEQLIVKNIMM